MRHSAGRTTGPLELQACHCAADRGARCPPRGQGSGLEPRAPPSDLTWVSVPLARIGGWGAWLLGAASARTSRRWCITPFPWVASGATWPTRQEDLLAFQPRAQCLQRWPPTASDPTRGPCPQGRAPLLTDQVHKGEP